MCREAGTGEVMSIFRLEDTHFLFLESILQIYYPFSNPAPPSHTHVPSPAESFPTNPLFEF